MKNPNIIENPCYKEGKNCPKRCLGCHGKCEEYSAFQKAKAEQNSAIRNQKFLNSLRPIR